MFYFEMVSAPNQFLDSEEVLVLPGAGPHPDGGNALAALDLAYLERAAAYEQSLPEGYRKIIFSGMPVQRHLVLSVDLPGEQLSVTFDEALDAMLMRIYIVHGWAGVLHLERALEAAQASNDSRALHPWDLIVPFYLFARNRLILLIRNSLIALERQAVTATLVNIRSTHDALQDGWLTFSFPREGPSPVTAAEQPLIRDTPRTELATAMGNRPLSSRLMPLVEDAVRCREILLRKQDIFFGYEDGSPPASVEMDLAEAQTAFAAACEKVGAVAPLAILAVPQLRAGFLQAAMESSIGLIMWRFKQDAAELLSRIKQGESQVEAMFPVPDSAFGGRGLELLYPLGYHIEEQCVSQAIKLAGKSPAHLVLQSEAIWLALFRQVAGTGGLPKIVAAQYIAVLMACLEAEASLNQLVSGVWARFEALLGLAALVVPALRIPSLVIGLSSSVYLSWRAVASIDEATKQRLAEDSPAMGNLLALGELGAVRKEYLEQLTGAAIRELAFLVAGGRWTGFKRLMHLRGYHQNLEDMFIAVRGPNTDG